MVTLLLLGLFLANNNEGTIVSIFELNNQGACVFEGYDFEGYDFKGDSNSINHYQLLEGSRFSFIGCWLLLQPTMDNADFNTGHSHAKKRIFIFRDSVTEQDFSRLANVITQLNYPD